MLQTVAAKTDGESTMVPLGQDYPEIRESIRERLAFGNFDHQVVGQHVARRVPRHDPTDIGQSGELETPMQRRGADPVQQDQGRRGRRSPISRSPPTSASGSPVRPTTTASAPSRFDASTVGFGAVTNASSARSASASADSASVTASFAFVSVVAMRSISAWISSSPAATRRLPHCC